MENNDNNITYPIEDVNQYLTPEQIAALERVAQECKRLESELAKLQEIRRIREDKIKEVVKYAE